MVGLCCFLLKSLQVANHEVENKITVFLVSTPFDLFTLVLLLYASVQITSIKIKFMRLLLSVGVEGWAASHACPYYIVLMSVWDLDTCHERSHRDRRATFGQTASRGPSLCDASIGYAFLYNKQMVRVRPNWTLHLHRPSLNLFPRLLDSLHVPTLVSS